MSAQCVAIELNSGERCSFVHHHRGFHSFRGYVDSVRIGDRVVTPYLSEPGVVIGLDDFAAWVRLDSGVRHDWDVSELVKVPSVLRSVPEAMDEAPSFAWPWGRKRKVDEGDASTREGEGSVGTTATRPAADGVSTSPSSTSEPFEPSLRALMHAGLLGYLNEPEVHVSDNRVVVKRSDLERPFIEMAALRADNERMRSLLAELRYYVPRNSGHGHTLAEILGEQP